MVLVNLQSSEGKIFEVEMEVAKKSILIKTLLEDSLVCLFLFLNIFICLSNFFNIFICLSVCLFLSLNVNCLLVCLSSCSTPLLLFLV